MAKDRGLKTRVPISSTIKIDLHEWLKDYSEESGISISRILDRAIESYQKIAKK